MMDRKGSDSFRRGDTNLYGYVLNDPINFIDPEGLLSIDSDDIATFSAGLGDVMLMGYGDELRDLFDVDSQMIDRCSGVYTAGEVTGVVISMVLGARAGGAKGAGNEFSHAIPDRVLKQAPKTVLNLVRNTLGKSKLNGNYVTRMEHMLNDPYRYRFMPRVDKLLNPINPAIQRYWNRIPNLLKGTGLGLFGLGQNDNDCGCD